jgi:hypothetical protein
MPVERCVVIARLDRLSHTTPRKPTQTAAEVWTQDDGDAYETYGTQSSPRTITDAAYRQAVLSAIRTPARSIAARSGIRPLGSPKLVRGGTA